MKKISYALAVMICAELFFALTLLTGADAAELKAYPGVRYDDAFSFIADRVAKINSRGVAARVTAAPSDVPPPTVSSGDMWGRLMKMNSINEQIKTIEEEIRKAKASDMDEASLKLFLEQSEQMISTLESIKSNDANPSKNTNQPKSQYVTFQLDQLPSSEAMEGYDPDDQEKTAEWAFSVAGDMASAMVFERATPGLVNAAGLAVSVYPHPLVLNNYAGLLKNAYPDDALFFYHAALEYEPENPLILTNIGMTHIDMGNYEAAKEYALAALHYNPESGPAHQILTLCHLKDGNSVLAAGTLFKSARDCFDELTVRLFDSYFDAVDDLEKESEDKGKYPDFPINELVLDLLYEMAMKYVDTADVVNANIDTPAGQFTVKPYPPFGDGEHILSSIEDYAVQLNEDHRRQAMALEKKRNSLENKTIYSRESSPETLAVMKNLRQYYAYRTLEKYYGYMYRKKHREAHYNDDNKLILDVGLWNELREDLWKTWKEAYIRESNIENEGDAQIDSLYKQLHNSSLLGLPLEPIRARIEATKLSYRLKFYRQCQIDLGLIFNHLKRYAERYVELDKRWYDECKQLMEEFWLKAGGVLQYMTDPDMLELCEAKREEFVLWRVRINTYNKIGSIAIDYHFPVDEFKADEQKKASVTIDHIYYGIGSITHIWSVTKNFSVDHYYQQYAFYQERIDDELKRHEQYVAANPSLQPPAPFNFSGSPIDIEGRALQVYKDPNAKPTQGFSFAGYYFRYGAGEESWHLPFIGRSKYDYGSGKTTIYEQDYNRQGIKPLDRQPSLMSASVTAYDVAARAAGAHEMKNSVSDFMEKWVKNIHELDEFSQREPGRLKRGLGMIGDVTSTIGFARAAYDVKSAGDITYSKYVTRDNLGRVVDQGTVYERQVGGEIRLPGGTGSYGLDRTTTVSVSKMTGVATKFKTLSHQYSFAGVGVTYSR